MLNQVVADVLSELLPDFEFIVYASFIRVLGNKFCDRLDGPTFFICPIFLGLSFADFEYNLEDPDFSFEDLACDLILAECFYQDTGFRMIFNIK